MVGDSAYIQIFSALRLNQLRWSHIQNSSKSSRTKNKSDFFITFHCDLWSKVVLKYDDGDNNEPKLHQILEYYFHIFTN